MAEFAGLKSVVVQCKFSANATGTLPFSALSDEIEKVERLAERGLCDGYLVK